MYFFYPVSPYSYLCSGFQLIFHAVFNRKNTMNIEKYHITWVLVSQMFVV